LALLDTRFFRSPLEPADQRNAAGRERHLPDGDPGKTMLARGWSCLDYASAGGASVPMRIYLEDSEWSRLTP
jgi:hypothetical protein